jgi:proteasome alpha subunit
VEESNRSDDTNKSSAASVLPTDAASLLAHLRSTVGEKSIECAVLERNYPGTSKYRALKADELGRLLPKDLRQAVTG